MLDRIRRSFHEGIKQIKLFASFLSERAKVETFELKQFYATSKLVTRLDMLYSDIGKRVIELEAKGEKEVYKDFILLPKIDEVKKLKKQIEEHRGSNLTAGESSE
ncbi:MAG: hypothetical protein KAI96_00875 [Thermodesulfovibrionia bacterium]|nr:hypothetical protein [Thermodesulfovibrionia bacterium]MCK5511326.1 hypothetical protein [Thermodesulfovibrionia bacterium]